MLFSSSSFFHEPHWLQTLVLQSRVFSTKHLLPKCMWKRNIQKKLSNAQHLWYKTTSLSDQYVAVTLVTNGPGSLFLFYKCCLSFTLARELSFIFYLGPDQYGIFGVDADADTRPQENSDI